MKSKKKAWTVIGGPVQLGTYRDKQAAQRAAKYVMSESGGRLRVAQILVHPKTKRSSLHPSWKSTRKVRRRPGPNEWGWETARGEWVRWPRAKRSTKTKRSR